MKDELLLKISLTTSILGILILFIFMQFSEVEYMSVKNFSDISKEKNIINDVYIVGLVDTINENNKTLLIDLVEYRQIKQKAVFFKENSSIIGIHDGDIIEISGNWYNGKLVLNTIDKIQTNNTFT